MNKHLPKILAATILVTAMFAITQLQVATAPGGGKTISFPNTYVAVSSLTIAPGTINSVSVGCFSGDKLLSGGFSAGSAALSIVASKPLPVGPNPTSWFARALNAPNTNPPEQLEVFAVCADLTP